ncbi:hypothetical protein [Streptomyces phaeochromogenes]|uniref:hypothetical protein n=1 Tax=Streptomyces phaeochromogenes TaxID=1923 RepID=UPI000A54258E|nr:hypothetical protein [Streptomyces phaeochromogenes]
MVSLTRTASVPSRSPCTVRSSQPASWASVRDHFLSLSMVYRFDLNAGDWSAHEPTRKNPTTSPSYCFSTCRTAASARSAVIGRSPLAMTDSIMTEDWTP